MHAFSCQNGPSITADNWRGVNASWLRYPDKRWETIQVEGNTVTRPVSWGMPKLRDEWLDSVFFLYESEKDARDGKYSGGTGFFVGYPLSIPNRPEIRHMLYAVTNKHVVIPPKPNGPGSTVIRYIKKDGSFGTVQTDPADWDFIPGGNDIAVTPIPFHIHQAHYTYIPIHLFVEPEEDWFIGDEIFMLGRFVDSNSSAPSARFGHISMMPHEVDGNESFCIDMHSRTGFSGSPVFVYRTPARDFTKPDLKIEYTIRLLGIHWGQFPEMMDIKGGKIVYPDGSSVDGDPKLEGLSGMTLTAPAWHIRKLLEMPKAVENRKRAEAMLAEQLKNEPMPAKLESAENPDKEGDEILKRMLNTPPKPHDR